MFLVSMIPSNTNYAIHFPAISRSLISKSSPEFFGVISLARNFFGHSKRQILGSSSYFPGSKTPPTPSPDAYTQSKHLKSPMTNFFAVVGSNEHFLSVFSSLEMPAFHLRNISTELYAVSPTGFC